MSRVRAALLVPVLLAVLVASALNLVLGGAWVLAVLALLACRRRTAWLVLVGSLAVAVTAGTLGGLPRPVATTYAAAEAGWLAARWAHVRPAPASEGGGAPGAAAVAVRLAALRQEELGDTARQLERRALAAIAASRELTRLRSRAPDTVAGAEEAVRRLALTLTAAEFQDLDGRRARLAAWLDGLAARLAAAGDEAEVRTVAQALDPATLAPVSLGALRADLTRAEAAIDAALRALSGAGVAATASLRVEYDEPGRLLVAESRQVVDAGGALRIVRVDLRGADRGDVTLAADGAPARPVTPGGEVSLPARGVARVAVTDRRAWPAAAGTSRPPLRLVPFVRLAVPLPVVADWQELPVTIALDEGRGPEIPLVVLTGRPRLESIDLPRHAVHHADPPGRLERRGDRDVWTPAGGVPAGGVTFELVPAGRGLRNSLFLGVKDYLYTPNPAAALGCLGAAALAVVLVRRLRPPSPAS